MAKLEELERGMLVRGIVPQQIVNLVDIQSHSPDAVTVIFKRNNGQLGSQVLYRDVESSLEIVTDEIYWSFKGNGNTLRLVSEAYRIHLAYLFDPLLAVHTSLIEPLPHQITAVYDEMLTRQPMRYLLADDPGAGKTIMAGLLIRELMVRGDVRRCLICAPGSLTEQWQDELWQKFQLVFEIFSREMADNIRTGNPFDEVDFVIVRLDQVSRSEELQTRLRNTDWDLVVVDEAHKMAASFFGGDLKETKRYKLGKLLSGSTRHFLLMTATPHNGKEEDFQLFLALLDADRFEGRFRDGVHHLDVSDLMRRMVKEKLLKFDGKPLFPERRAYTINYALSSEEDVLYRAVTDYVQQEFNRADQLDNEGRKGTVGFALTVLQRRLASSPEAIYQSLKRRRERLEKRLKEAERARHNLLQNEILNFDEEDWDDLEESLELEQHEIEFVDSATAASTIAELEHEILSLRELEQMALKLRRGGTDRKWQELLHLLQNTPEMHNPKGGQRKLVLFTEHRDTLNYLYERLTTLTGSDNAIVMIHGGMHRDERRMIEHQFRNNPDVVILLATDAAGEGINLQRAHLMVNYDLPWNPNRLEQRFGRIHRIGQTEVCHLWNLVAGETREGHVYQRLLRKLEAERHALNGQVFDVLGKLFQETPLRKLLIDAVRYGDDPRVRARLEEAVDNAVDQDHVRDLLEQHSLINGSLDTSKIMRIREDMERASARRLQPHYIKAFFLEAFPGLGGTLHERENGRYAINNVPAVIRNWAKEQGLGAIATKYERICFEKSLINQQPTAAFICPGHPLLDAVMGLILHQYRDALLNGAILIDETDPEREPRVLFYLEQAIQDAQRIISREIHFVEIDRAGTIREGGGAPYLDYRAATHEESGQLQSLLQADWLKGDQLEKRASAYAVENLVKTHLARVQKRRLELIEKTEAAVQERLTKEINYWEKRAVTLQESEKQGKVNARINSAKAWQRADELAERLTQRKEQLRQEREISALPPVIIGGALIVPIGLLLGDHTPPEILDRRITEKLAMQAVMQAEIAMNNDPKDVSAHNLGYDIESHDGQTGELRFIEVKGRRAGADTVTVTRNEILTAFNTREKYFLALVEIEGKVARQPRYVRQPFTKEPDFAMTKVEYNIKKLLELSEGASA